MFEFVKVANTGEADQILNAIYRENPEFWSSGLTRGHFDGGLWLIRKQASREAIGFTGWQVREELADKGMRKVGYYAIGVIPEYRGCGVAKEAVARMLREKSAEVDVVRALIHPDNHPSLALADSLGVEIEKRAGSRLQAIGKALSGIGASSLYGGASSAIMHDQVVDPSRSLLSTLRPDTWDKERILQGLVNFGIGAAGGGTARHALGHKARPAVGRQAARTAKDFNALQFGIGTSSILGGPIIKDLAMHGHKGIDAVDRIANQPPGGLSTRDKVIAGLLAAAGIGTAAYAAKSISNSTDRLAKANGPKARVTLPTRDPNDGETSLEVSMPDINLSKNILTGLNRDLRGRLREENKERVGHYRRNKARLKNLGINMNDEGEILGRNAEQQEDMIVNA